MHRVGGGVPVGQHQAAGQIVLLPDLFPGGVPVHRVEAGGGVGVHILRPLPELPAEVHPQQGGGFLLVLGEHQPPEGNPLRLDPLGQTAHDAHAVLAADGVGAAAGEADDGGFIPEIRTEPVPQAVHVLHECLVALINGSVIVGVAMDGHGVALIDHPADQGLAGLAVVDDEEGGVDVIGLQSVQHPGRHPVAGAVIEGQVHGASAGGVLIHRHLPGGRGSVARLVGHGIGQGIDPGNGGVHSAGPGDGGGQIAVGVVLGGVARLLIGAAQGNEQLPLAGQGDHRGHDVPDRHPAGGGGGVSGLVGNGVGQGVDVAGGFVRYLDGGGQVAVTAVSGGGSRVLE